MRAVWTECKCKFDGALDAAEEDTRSHRSRVAPGCRAKRASSHTSYSNLALHTRRVCTFGTHSEPPNPTRPAPGTLVGAFEFFVFGVSMLLPPLPSPPLPSPGVRGVLPASSAAPTRPPEINCNLGSTESRLHTAQNQGTTKFRHHCGRTTSPGSYPTRAAG